MSRHMAEFYSPDNPCGLEWMDDSLGDFRIGEKVLCWAVRESARCPAVLKIDGAGFTSFDEGECVADPYDKSSCVA